MPLNEAHSDFPLPTVWRTPLNWYFIAPYAPLLMHEHIVARCGQAIVRIQPEDGHLISRTDIALPGLTGAFLLRHKETLITDTVREPERLASILAVTPEGDHRWRLDTSAIVAPGNARLIDRALYLLGVEPGRGRMVYAIDPDRGTVLSSRKLRWGANALVPIRDRLLVRNQTIDEGDPGLYTMSRDGDDERALLDASVWLLARDASRVLTVSRTTMDAPRTLQVWDAETLEPSWSAAAVAEVAALDDDDVIHLAEGGAYGTPVAREARSGVERWRGEPLPYSASSCRIVGPLVIASYMLGAAFYQRVDGAYLGSVTGHYSPPLRVGSNIVLFGERAAVCLSLETLEGTSK